MLLNIDKPLRTATLHEANCTYVPKPHGTIFKPVEDLGRDGGWFAARSESEAKTIANLKFPRGQFKVCQYCSGRA